MSAVSLPFSVIETPKMGSVSGQLRIPSPLGGEKDRLRGARLHDGLDSAGQDQTSSFSPAGSELDHRQNAWLRTFAISGVALLGLAIVCWLAKFCLASGWAWQCPIMSLFHIPCP